MKRSTVPAQHSANTTVEPDDATREYFAKRCLTSEVALCNGIVPIAPQLAASELQFLPRQLPRATAALLIRCRDFDGTYNSAANQIVLFGAFVDEKSGEQVSRMRLSARGVKNRIAWYGNTSNPSAVIYCESRIKALVASQANPSWLCAGLNGVDGWSQGKNKEDHPVPADNLIPPIKVSALPAILLPDSNHHKRVRLAMQSLAAQLRPHFQSVSLAKLPPPVDGREDWGADDVAAFAGDPKVLNLFASSAENLFSTPLTFSADNARFPWLFREEPAPPEFIVDGILPLEVGVLSATGGMGKTTLMLWLAVHVALGRSVLGHKVERPGAVLFITGEDTRAIFQYRLYRICEQLKLTDEDRRRIANNLYVEDVSNSVARFAEADARGNLSPTGLVDRIVAEYAGRNVSLAVCDPLISFSPGERFVNDGAQALLIQARRLCAGLRAAVVLVNHVSKLHAQAEKPSQHAGRGGTAIGDGCRFEYELLRTPDKEAKQVPPVPDATLYSLYVHKLSHAARPELPYVIARTGFALHWLETNRETNEQKEMKRNAAHEKQLTEQAMRLVAHMQTLDLVKTPETATSLKHTAAEIIGCPVNAIPGVVQHALRKGLLEERELPQGQRRGQRTHSLHVAPRKF